MNLDRIRRGVAEFYKQEKSDFKFLKENPKHLPSWKDFLRMNGVANAFFATQILFMGYMESIAPDDIETLPAHITFASFFAPVILRMKYNSSVAFAKSMKVLKEGVGRSDPLKGVKILAGESTGNCSRMGIRRSLIHFFGKEEGIKKYKEVTPFFPE